MTSSVDLIQGLSGSIAFKPPCRVATTAPITLSGLQTVDTVDLVDGDRVLVKDEVDKTRNGIYNASSSAWTRALDFNGRNDAILGTLVNVVSGFAGDGLWQLITPVPIIGTSDLEFALFAADGNTGGSGSNYYANFVGDGVTVTFCLPTTPGSIANTLVVVAGVVMAPNVDYTLTGNCITFLTAPADTVGIYVNYTTSSAVSTTILEYSLTATGGETAITVPYTYSPNSGTIAVYQNGLLLYPNVHYVETSGTVVTLTTAAVAGDVYYFRIGQLVNNGDTIVVADASIGTVKLIDEAVTTAKIADDAVTFDKLQNIATDRLVGRVASGSGNAVGLTINSFTAEATLDANADYLLFWDASVGAHRKALLSAVLGGGGTLGFGQTWQDVLTSPGRTTNTPYQNNTGKPIQVSVTITSVDAYFYVSADGSTWVAAAVSNSTERGPMNVVVPNTHWYKVVPFSGSFTHLDWAELR